VLDCERRADPVGAEDDPHDRSRDDQRHRGEAEPTPVLAGRRSRLAVKPAEHQRERVRQEAEIRAPARPPRGKTKVEELHGERGGDEPRDEPRDCRVAADEPWRESGRHDRGAQTGASKPPRRAERRIRQDDRKRIDQRRRGEARRIHSTLRLSETTATGVDRTAVVRDRQACVVPAAWGH
jgi:hypothetical protein